MLLTTKFVFFLFECQLVHIYFVLLFFLHLTFYKFNDYE